MATAAVVRNRREPDHRHEVVSGRWLASGSARDDARRALDRLRTYDQPAAMSKMRGLSSSRRMPIVTEGRILRERLLIL